MVHSFLLIGQSNMAGRGDPAEVEPISGEHIKILVNGRWQPYMFPVNRDRRTSGVCLAESFAEKYAVTHGVDVGIIPCADGGTALEQWREGGLLYDHAVYMSRLASRTSTIAGVLWHQGESDCRDERYPFYEERFTAMMQAFRRDLDLYDVPFLLGGLGDFLPLRNPIYEKNAHKLNSILAGIAEKNPMTGFVSANGLSANADNLHFSAASLREFGLRYYSVFDAIENKSKVFAEKMDADRAIRTGMEEL